MASPIIQVHQVTDVAGSEAHAAAKPISMTVQEVLHALTQTQAHHQAVAVAVSVVHAATQTIPIAAVQAVLHVRTLAQAHQAVPHARTLAQAQAHHQVAAVAVSVAHVAAVVVAAASEALAAEADKDMYHLPCTMYN